MITPSNLFMQLLSELPEVLGRAAQCLLMAISGIPPIDEIAQLTYVKQQAESVASVASDVQLLLTHARHENIAGLCRIAFESRINMYAAMRASSFAAQKYLGQVKSHVHELQALIKNGDASSLPLQRELEHHERLLASMRLDFQGLSERNWNLKEAAIAAELLPDYNEHYSFLSKAAHNTPSGLAAKADPRVLVGSALRLMHDTIEACACLMFFRETDDTSPKPLTKNWSQLTGPVALLQTEYERLTLAFEGALQEEFGQ